MSTTLSALVVETAGTWPGAWEAVLGAEPAPAGLLASREIDRILEAVADFADL